MPHVKSGGRASAALARALRPSPLCCSKTQTRSSPPRPSATAKKGARTRQATWTQLGRRRATYATRSKPSQDFVRDSAAPTWLGRRLFEGETQLLRALTQPPAHDVDVDARLIGQHLAPLRLAMRSELVGGAQGRVPLDEGAGGGTQS